MRTLMTQTFTFHDITTMRRTVAQHAAACGLSGSRLDDFVLAVHESVVNVVEHAGGYGHFRLWTVDGVIRSETRDRGAGIPDGYVNGHHRPSDQGASGRGIYLIRRLCDSVDFRTGAGGTTVRLTMRLPRKCAGDGRLTMRRVRVTAGGGDSLGDFTA
ncbi:ATP-binding protein [Nonomuraea jiangxiensis]|uniref:Anti-sigma regulatory factor (Ser/Thr protein kinase) n=1 Tax=Nonomuraea jiangxiensis TaxID=633440 RepID=A0A1G9SZU3_9ACTN|nr:ATP-binding protein [Nonomuraea jiangxiensis]SDM40993.1 Anti-sigma regulatory factor (Ser/Thr protein kinase) [Nonomuraea jiangxiensis]